MIQIFLLLSLNLGFLIAAEKVSPSPSDVVSLSSKVKDGKTFTIAKIPYGLTMQISCPQKEAEQSPSEESSAHPEEPGKSQQTVQIVSARYLVPEGAKNCKSTDLMSAEEIQACSKQASAACTINSKDSSKQRGCEKRRLGIKYFCDDVLPSAPPKVFKLMPTHMLDDFD